MTYFLNFNHKTCSTTRPLSLTAFTPIFQFQNGIGYELNLVITNCIHAELNLCFTTLIQ